jgi:hypothetical protein
MAVVDLAFTLPCNSVIRPVDAPAFIGAQVIGEATTLLFRWLVPALPRTAEQVILSHEQSRL